MRYRRVLRCILGKLYGEDMVGILFSELLSDPLSRCSGDDDGRLSESYTRASSKLSFLVTVVQTYSGNFQSTLILSTKKMVPCA